MILEPYISIIPKSIKQTFIESFYEDQESTKVQAVYNLKRNECREIISVSYKIRYNQSFQLLSHVQFSATPWTTTCQASLSITNSQSLLKLCPLSRWCHPTISASVVSFSSRLQSCPASGYFPVSQFLALSGQSIGTSASTSVLPMSIQDWFPLGLTDLISLQSKGLSRVFANTQFKSISSSVLSFLYCSTLTSIHDYWKNHSLDEMDLFLAK